MPLYRQQQQQQQQQRQPPPLPSLLAAARAVRALPADGSALPWHPLRDDPTLAVATHSVYCALVERIASSSSFNDSVRHCVPLCCEMERLGVYDDRSLMDCGDAADLGVSLLQRLRPERQAVRPRAALERLLPHLCAAWWPPGGVDQAAAPRVPASVPFINQPAACQLLQLLIACTMGAALSAHGTGAPIGAAELVRRAPDLQRYAWSLVYDHWLDQAASFDGARQLRRWLDAERAALPASRAAETLVAGVNCALVRIIVRDAPAISAAADARGLVDYSRAVHQCAVARARLLADDVAAAAASHPYPLFPVPPRRRACSPPPVYERILRSCDAWLAENALLGTVLYERAIEYALQASADDDADDAPPAFADAGALALWEDRAVPTAAAFDALAPDVAMALRDRCERMARVRSIRSFPLPAHVCREQLDSVRRMFGADARPQDFGSYLVCRVHRSLKAPVIQSATSSLLAAAHNYADPILQPVAGRRRSRPPNGGTTRVYPEPRRDSPIARLPVQRSPLDIARNSGLWKATLCDDDDASPATTATAQSVHAWRAALVKVLAELISPPTDPFIQPSDKAVCSVGALDVCLDVANGRTCCDVGPVEYALPLSSSSSGGNDDADATLPAAGAEFVHNRLPIVGLSNERARAAEAARAGSGIDLRTSHAALIDSLHYLAPLRQQQQQQGGAGRRRPVATATRYVDSRRGVHKAPILDELRNIACRGRSLHSQSLLFHLWQFGGDASSPPRYIYLCPRCLSPTVYHPLRGDSLGAACGACLPVRDILQLQHRMAHSDHCVACPLPVRDLYDVLRRPPGSGARPSHEKPQELSYFVVYDDVDTHRLMIAGLCNAHNKPWLSHTGRIEPISSVLHFVHGDVYARRLQDGSVVPMAHARTYSASGTLNGATVDDDDDDGGGGGARLFDR